MTDHHLISPVIRRLYPELDPGQLELIGHIAGPTLGVAGPGAGKTLALALRAANILLLEKAQPSELLLCTYNTDAAVELRRRLETVTNAAGYTGDLALTRVSTIHSLCGKFLAAHSEPAAFKPGFRLLDRDQQWRFLYQQFDQIFGPDLACLGDRGWHQPQAVVRNALEYFDRMCEEMIMPLDLINSAGEFPMALGHCYQRYENLLLELGQADFAHLQKWTALLLYRNEDVADRLAADVRYLMCDEFQDTSFVQWAILRRLAVAHGNLCVVGDDDQCLYRFRGARVGNILQFPSRQPGCRTVELNVNYRSHPSIVRAYDSWMASADWSNPVADGEPFRHAKTIVPHDSGRYGDYPAVIAVDGLDHEDEGRQLSQLLRFLKQRGVIREYGQVALLLHSVRDGVAGPYQDLLESSNIPVRCVSAGSGRTGSGQRPTMGAVTVTTIHQAKGREWPVVIVGSLNFSNPHVDPVGYALRPHFRRPEQEPAHRIATFDQMRQHYVACSRPKDLLVLTASGTVHPRFETLWKEAPRWRSLNSIQLSALAGQRFRDSGGEPSPDPPTPPEQIHRLRRIDVRLRSRCP